MNDMTLAPMRFRPLHTALLAALCASPLCSALRAQQPAAHRLTLAQAFDAARRASPDVRAAQQALAAAAARARQAGAYSNPTFTYDREQTSASGQSNSQNIAAIQQRVELGGIRSARIDAARLRRDAAQARLAAAETQLVFEATRAYALAAASDRRALLADQAAEAFTQAMGISQSRLAAGDVSGYAHRRIRLEAARYATVRAEALLARRSARLALGALVSAAPDSIMSLDLELTDSLPLAADPFVKTVGAMPNGSATEPSLDSLVRVALRSRPDLHALELEASAARAEAQVAARERIPVPALSLGFKNERIAGTSGQANGFVAGVSIPLPFWDRRAGAIAAADADARQRVAETNALQRRVVREVAEAYDAYRSLELQLEMLRPQLGVETRTAMRAVQVAYSEGEITLVEWLDAVRAYQEVESSFAMLRAEALIRRATLERAVGAQLFSPTTPRSGAEAPAKD